MSVNSRMSPLRRDLAAVVVEETGMLPASANALVARILDRMADHVADNDRTEIRGFGTFVWVLHKERHMTGGLFGKRTIPAYRHLKFRSSSIRRRAGHGNQAR